MSVAYKDYYKVLDVSKTASTEEIAKAYKKLARKHHPDLNAGDSASEEKFKDVNEAHEVLKDPEKRRRYDQLGSNWQDGQQFRGASGFENMNFNFGGGGAGSQFGGDFSDFFETIFGQREGFNMDGQRQRRGRDIEADLYLTLEEVVKGGEKPFTLNTTEGARSLKLNIPAGIKDKGKLRLSGQGGSGSPSGDLYLTINYAKHPHFEVDKDAITCEVEIAPWEAVLGTQVRVPTLNGEVEMKIPAGTSSGRKLRLRGKGLGISTARGDEYVRIAIKVPVKLSPEEEELWKALANIATGTAGTTGTKDATAKDAADTKNATD